MGTCAFSLLSHLIGKNKGKKKMFQTSKTCWKRNKHCYNISCKSQTLALHHCLYTRLAILPLNLKLHVSLDVRTNIYCSNMAAGRVRHPPAKCSASTLQLHYTWRHTMRGTDRCEATFHSLYHVAMCDLPRSVGRERSSLGRKISVTGTQGRLKCRKVESSNGPTVLQTNRIMTKINTTQ